MPKLMIILNYSIDIIVELSLTKNEALSYSLV